MANEQIVGDSPVYFSGDSLLLQVTVNDSAGNALDLQALGLTEATWVLAKKQGSAPLVTKTLGSGKVDRGRHHDAHAHRHHRGLLIMANEQIVGDSPVYFSGDSLLLQVTVNDSAGNALDLQALGLTEATWVLAKKQGSAPLVTKTLGSGVVITTPPGTDGRLDIQIDNADTATLKGTHYHELQLEPGPLTALFGDFIIQADSASP